MARHQLTKLQLLEYALEGVRTQIGTHPCPNDYPDEIEELEAHERQIQRRIKATERGLAQHEEAEGQRSSAIVLPFRS